MLMLYVVSCYFFRRALSLLKRVFVPIADDVAVVAVSKNVTGTPEYIADGTVMDPFSFHLIGRRLCNGQVHATTAHPIAASDGRPPTK